MKYLMERTRHILRRIREGRLKELLSQWLWMAKYVRRYWLAIGGYTLLNMTGSLLGLGTSMVSRTLVDSVTGHNSGLLGIAAAAYVGVGVGQIFISAIRSRLSLKINLHISNGVRLDIFHQIIETDWESLSEFSPGDLQYRLNGDVMAVINNVLTFIPSLCSMLVSFGGALIVMLQNDPTMAAIALCGAPISLIVSRYNIRKMREYEKKNQEFASKNVSFNQEIFQHMQTIKAFGLVDTFTRRYEDRQKESVRIQLDRNKFQQRGSIATSLVGQAIGYACYGFAIYRLWRGDITYGSMTMLVGMAGSLRGSFSSVVNLVPSAIRACISAGRIMEVTGLPREESAESPNLRRILSQAQKQGVSVRMENVTAGYPGDKAIYTGANFLASPGEIIGLVGPSGLGKTTTLKLLLGLLHPREGQVTVASGGLSPEPVSTATRRLFSYIPQGNTLFSGTIAENLRLLCPEASDQELERALRAACAWDFVQDLPEGMDTDTGDNGQRFSEGQKQRISIARAILADTPVLLLDEATSALDVATERKVLHNIIRHDPTRTVVVTAHRPSVFAQCSRVYLVGDGQFEEINEERLQQFLEGAGEPKEVDKSHAYAAS